jgi:hypothetical protein
MWCGSLRPTLPKTTRPALQKMSAPQPAAPAAVAAPSDLPNDKVLRHAAKIALEQDKPILLDYYKESRAGTAFLGQDKDTGEKMLVKSAEEYTSPVNKMFKAVDDYIIVTENSVYVVSGLIKKKEISSAGM